MDIKENIICRLYTDDKDHGRKHIYQVLESLDRYVVDMNIAKENKRLLEIAVLYHDCDMSERKNHHILSAEKFLRLEDEITSTLSQEERNIISQTIREHRSSGEWDDKSYLGKIVCKVDSGYPIDLTNTLERAISYRLKKGNTVDFSVYGAIEHLEEKYSSRGYAAKQYTLEELAMIDKALMNPEEFLIPHGLKYAKNY